MKNQSNVNQDIKYVRDQHFPELLELFKKEYPKCFNDEMLPLSIGIDNKLYDLHKSQYTHFIIKQFLEDYTSDRTYRLNIITDAKRYDLDGTVTHVVLEKEEQYAKKRLRGPYTTTKKKKITTNIKKANSA